MRGKTNSKLFLRTLIENPQLSDLVTEVALLSWVQPSDRDDAALDATASQVSQEMDALYSKAICRIQPDCHTRKTVKHLRLGQSDAEIFLLAAVCRNIEILEVMMPENIGQDIVVGSDLSSWIRSLRDGSEYHELGDDPDQEPPSLITPLLKLKSLHIRPGKYVASLNVIYMSHCNVLKHAERSGLETLYVDRAGHGFFSHLPTRALFPSLTHLHLRGFKALVLGHIVQLLGFYRLQTFEIEVKCDRFRESLAFSQLGDSIRRHGTTLKRLSIDTRRVNTYYPARYQETPVPGFIHHTPLPEPARRLGDLSSLHQLEYLRAPVKQLVMDLNHAPVKPDSQQRTNNIYSQLSFILPSIVKQVVLLDYFGDYRKTAGRSCEIYDPGEGGDGFIMHKCNHMEGVMFDGFDNHCVCEVDSGVADKRSAATKEDAELPPVAQLAQLSM